jgi:hypothetical protein
MNYSVRITNKDNQGSITEIDSSERIAVYFGDKIEILSNRGSGFFSSLWQ